MFEAVEEAEIRGELVEKRDNNEQNMVIAWVWDLDH